MNVLHFAYIKLLYFQLQCMNCEYARCIQLTFCVFSEVLLLETSDTPFHVLATPTLVSCNASKTSPKLLYVSPPKLTIIPIHPLTY